MNIDKLIGNTPIVKITIEYQGIIRNIYAKLEYYNLTGSIKDRIAYYIIKKSKEIGLLKEKMPIIEATSGNTGISLAAIGALYKHPVHIFMPDWVSQERSQLMKLYGANIYYVTKEEGGFKEAIKRADNLANQINGFRTNQFSNKLNIDAHYETTGKEIVDKVPNIEAYVSGIGTGGTLIGVAKRIKEVYKNASIIAMEPIKMPLLSGGKVIGNHKIEGIGDDFIPELVDKNLIDEVITIDDNEAINMARRLSKELGLGVGISSGANFLASVLSLKDNVVTIFADDSKKYLTTDLTVEQNLNFISDQIKLLNIEVL